MADVDFNSLPFDQQVEIFDATPLLEAPRGAIPNYEHPHARNDVTIAVTVVGLAFTTIIYTLRMYSRLFIIKRMRKEDCMYPWIHLLLTSSWPFNQDVGMAGFVGQPSSCLYKKLWVSYWVVKTGHLLRIMRRAWCSSPYWWLPGSPVGGSRSEEHRDSQGEIFSLL